MKMTTCTPIIQTKYKQILLENHRGCGEVFRACYPCGAPLNDYDGYWEAGTLIDPATMQREPWCMCDQCHALYHCPTHSPQ